MKKVFFFLISYAFCTFYGSAQQQKTISRLEIIHVRSEKRTVVKEFDFRIEAPNWTPDGRYPHPMGKRWYSSHTEKEMLNRVPILQIKMLKSALCQQKEERLKPWPNSLAGRESSM